MGKEKPITPPHQWTHDGDKVLLLKCVPDGGLVTGNKSHGYGKYSFQWPLTVGETATAPDWNDRAECGGGLHGWPWGLSVGDGKEPDYQATWIVFSSPPGEVVGIEGKAKSKSATIVAVGTYLECYLHILSGQIAWTQHASSGAASATGWSGAASATGERGAASATGESGAASATGGRGAAVVTGPNGTVECGPTDIAVSTADVVYWKIRAGAVLCHRTEKGVWLLFADEWKVEDGEVVLVEHGVIWRNWQE